MSWCVDESLFGAFKAAGLTDDADARHLMYAVHNKGDRFVTTKLIGAVIVYRQEVRLFTDKPL